MRAIIISGVAALAAIANPALTRAADADVGHRFYAGTSLGATKFEDVDGHGSSFKLYGGYQFTENFGAEIGYQRLGDLRPANLAGQANTEVAKAHAFYTAGTARWQFTERFSVNGLLGVAHTVLQSGDLDQDDNSLMIGLGAQYRLSPRTELTMNLDHFGKVADDKSAQVLTAGVVVRF